MATTGYRTALHLLYQGLRSLPHQRRDEREVYETEEGTMQALAKVYGAWALTEGDVAGVDDGFTGFTRGFYNLQELLLMRLSVHGTTRP